MKAFMGDGKTVAEIPAEFTSAAEEARKQLTEAAAEGEDALLEKYLESGELTQEELVRGLKNIVRSGNYIPILCAAGGHEIGIAPLLNSIIELMPSPADRPAVTVQGKSGDETLPVSDTGPVALYVWKTNADPFVER
jgi:elongation factor G